jgi:Ca2+-binding RTX toxin-like protein
MFGWKLNEDGEFIDRMNNSNLTTLYPWPDLRPVDPADITFGDGSTSQIEIAATFPAHLQVSDEFLASSYIYDQLGGEHIVHLNFTKADHIQISGMLAQASNGNGLSKAIGISTPAALTIDGAQMVSVTTLDITISYVASDGKSTTWSVEAASDEGAIVNDSDDPIVITFDANGRLLDDSFINFEIEWDENLNARNSIFAVDLSNIEVSSNLLNASSENALNVEVNDVGAVLQLNVETDDRRDSISGEERFIQFDDNGLLITHEPVELEIDWSDETTIAQNTVLSVDIGTAGAADVLTISGADFYLNSISQNGEAKAELDHILSGPGGVFTAVLADGEEVILSDVRLGKIRNLDIPVHRASPEQPKLSTRRQEPEEKGAEADLPFSEFGYMITTDMLAGPVRLFGGITTDTLKAHASGAIVQAFDGDDRLFGGAGDDALYGGLADDIFYGLEGRDTFVGWLGDDTLDLHHSVSAVVIRGRSVASLEGDIAHISGIETIIATTFDDRIAMGGANQLIRGRSGQDTITTYTYDDEIHGNSGSDTLRSGHGDDRLYGGTGNDFMNAGRGQDLIFGGAGDDKAFGQNGEDEMSGGAGDDWLHAGNHNDSVKGEAGDDRLIGGGGEDRIEGGGGVDRINAGTGDDVLSSGAGIDILRGGIGADTFLMKSGFGIEKILDFTPDYDRIEFDSNGFNSRDDLQFTEFDDFLKITSSAAEASGNAVILVGIEMADLGADDQSF